MTRRALHTTDATRFKSCRLAWDFTSPLRRNLTPKRRVPAFGFGTAWHEALEVYYEPSTPRLVDPAVKAFEDSVGKWYQDIPNPDQEDDEVYANSLDLGVGMMQHYDEWASHYDDFEVVWVERHYEVEIPGLPVPYSFKPDGLALDDKGRYWILEHKSADKLPDNTEYLLMDDQCGKYLWALHVAEGIQAEGILYTIARKKLPTPLKVLKSTGMLSLDKRILTTHNYAARQIRDHHHGEIPFDYEDFLNRLRYQQNPFFKREFVRRNSAELRFIEDSVIAEAREMLDPDIAIYRNPNRFNCSTCAFVGPCLATAEGSNVDSMLEGNYEQNMRY